MLRAWADVDPIASWPASDPNEPPTEHRKRDRVHFVGRLGIGGAEFSAASAEVRILPEQDSDDPELRRVIDIEWLPIIASVWDHVVLHASGATHRPSGVSVAFVGTSRAGKSTTAFALSRLDGWSQVADDALALTRGERWRVAPLPNRVRLRQTAHARLHDGTPDEILVTNDGPTLAAIVLLDPSRTRGEHLEPASPTRAFTELLRQSYLLEDDRQVRAAHSERLLALISATPTFVLTYQPDFERQDRLLDLIRGLIEY